MLVTFFYLMYIYLNLSVSGRYIRVLEKLVSKDVIGKIYQVLNKKTQEEVSRKKSISQQQPKKVINWLLLIMSLSVVISVTMFFVETYLNCKSAQSAIANVGVSIDTIFDVEELGFSSNEVLTYVGFERFTFPNELSYTFKRNVTYGDPWYWKGYNISNLRDVILEDTGVISQKWSDLIYGSEKLETTTIIGKYSSVDKLITIGTDNCTDYMLKNNVSLSYASYQLYCVGLTTLIADLLSSSIQTIEQTYNFQHAQNNAAKNGTILNPVALSLMHNQLLRQSLPLVTKMIQFIGEFVKSSSDALIAIVITFSLLGFNILIVTSYFINGTISDHWKQVQTLRMMLNYIPLDILDRNERLRNIVLFHSFQSSRGKTNKVFSSDKEYSGYSKISKMIKVNVDGEMLCNIKGEIEQFNPAALRMFGCKTIEVLGTPMFNLFDKKEMVQKKIDNLLFLYKQQDGALNDDDEMVSRKFAETVECECIRRNQTKFPASLNIYLLAFGSEAPVFLVTMKDMTSEKKQQLLLQEEKKKSEDLLRNILPTAVATRLKAGDTFIAEKFNDITCFFR